MKRTAVLKTIQRAAKQAGLELEVFERTNHTGIRIGNVKTTLARHNEIAEGTAQALYKQLEPALGKRWWRK